MLAVRPDNVFLSAVKLCEDSDDLIIRVWEAHGEAARAHIKLTGPIPSVAEVDLLEDEMGAAETDGDGVVVDIKPYEIRTFKVGLARPPGHSRRPQ